MPYIPEYLREQYDPAIEELFEKLSSAPVESRAGILNYIISTLSWKLIFERPSYKSINEVIGVLECAKLELYGRLATKYEKKKREENGDLSGYKEYKEKYT